MSTQLQLRAGDMRCDLRPDLGGAIAGLWAGEVAVLRSTPGPALQAARRAGCYPLVPWSNRIAHARLEWNGTGHPLVKNNPPEAHAIHGVGWQRPWSVLDADDGFALLAQEHRPDEAWPFAYDASQSLRLTPGSLELALSVTNQAHVSAPVGLGWHPYFAKRPGGHLRFHARGRWEMGEDKLPAGHRDSRGIDAEVASLAVDHCYDGWDGVAELRDERMRVTVRSSLTRLVVCTDATRDFVAVEPVSHVNNAFALAAAGQAGAASLGLVTLAPGESMSIEMTMDVETNQ